MSYSILRGNKMMLAVPLAMGVTGFAAQQQF